MWARPEQCAPAGEWRAWLILAGRGWGKTRTGAEWVRDQVEQHGARRIALVGRTVGDVRDVIVEGESGILSVCPPWNRPTYEPSKRRLTWPNGAIATTYSADNPNELRGPQHDRALADELASWRYEEAWDQLLFGLRLGTRPQVVVATTPRPTKIIKKLRDDSQDRSTYSGQRVYITRGNTFDNTPNLAPAFIADIRAKYEGTRLGRQEIFADILDDNPKALWNRQRLEDLRVERGPSLFRRIVVAVDPAMTSRPESDETGIIVAGVGDHGHAYVLDDLSGKLSPNGWASRAIMAYSERMADRVVGETNNGGDLVESTLRTVDAAVSYKGVYASRGKYARAEPVAALYEQGKVHHVGMFAALEDQMCEWAPDESKYSPDRMDALVWALTELMLDDHGVQSERYA